MPGPGRIQRAISDILDEGGSWTITTLAQRVYGVSVVQKKHRVATIRAANAVFRRRPELAAWKVRGWLLWRPDDAEGSP